MASDTQWYHIFATTIPWKATIPSLREILLSNNSYLTIWNVFIVGSQTWKKWFEVAANTCLGKCSVLEHLWFYSCYSESTWGESTLDFCLVSLCLSDRLKCTVSVIIFWMVVVFKRLGLKTLIKELLTEIESIPEEFCRSTHLYSTIGGGGAAVHMEATSHSAGIL